MISDTTLIDVGGTLYARIPFDQVKYFELEPGDCTIEDISKDEARLVFRK